MSRLDALREKFGRVAAERVEKIRAGTDVERELHTLKGEADLLGFGTIARIAGALETLAHADPRPSQWADGLALIDRLRTSAPGSTSDEVEAFFTSLDP